MNVCQLPTAASKRPALLLNMCFHTCTYWSAGNKVRRYSQIFQIFPLCADTHMHTQTPCQSTPPLQEHWLTSAECRNACHRRSKTLTISEFTSAQAQGSARSDGPPNSLVIKDKDTEEGEGERNEGLRKEKEGGEECGYLLSDSPAEMC